MQLIEALNKKLKQNCSLLFIKNTFFSVEYFIRFMYNTVQSMTHYELYNLKYKIVL